MKNMYCILIVVLLNACVQSTAVAPKLDNYKANLSNVTNPKLTIRTTLEEQPPAYAYLATDIEVSDNYIKMTVPGSSMGIPIPGLKEQKKLYFKHLGTPIITKSPDTPVWNVQIVDKYGNDHYWAYISTREEAEKFVDALVYMIRNHK